jgi:murein L,D-transpeptidase YcbB/YkuD
MKPVGIGRSMLLVLGLVFTLVAVAGPPNPHLRAQVERMRAGDTVAIDGAHLAAPELIADFYEDRNFVPAWNDVDKIQSLLRIIDGMERYGLDPEDYHRRTLRALLEGGLHGLAPERRADLDLLLIDSLIRVAYHALHGKVDPATLDANWNFPRRPFSDDPVSYMKAAIDADSLERYFVELIPEPYFHARLRKGLEQYRTIAAAGGWPTVPNGPALKPGVDDPRVPILRERLYVLGEFGGPLPTDPTNRYDGALVEAAKTFQARHGLEADGIVGRRTLKAMNVPVAARIDQIRVNLERMRWVYRDLPTDYVFVDIAGFHIYLVRNNDIVWRSRVQVGRPYRETPIFRDQIRYLEFNPTWTVPPTILSEDILPATKQDPGYLRTKDIRILDRDGRTVSPTSIDWSTMSAANFPYTLRQEPGPDNALGRVKFMFPNKHQVYLHDTPSKDLFDRAQRTFSSGCIRVERPFELAALVLNDPAKWNQETLQALVDSKQTRRVNLSKPLPIILFYWTAEADENGVVTFREDIYGRDEQVLEALNGHFVFRAPQRMAAGPDATAGVN